MVRCRPDSLAMLLAASVLLLGPPGAVAQASAGAKSLQWRVPPVLPPGALMDVRDQPKIADAASELLQDVFGKNKNPCRLVYGVASLPLGTPVELELIFEVSA